MTNKRSQEIAITIWNLIGFGFICYGIYLWEPMWFLIGFWLKTPPISTSIFKKG